MLLYGSVQKNSQDGEYQIKREVAFQGCENEETVVSPDTDCPETMVFPGGSLTTTDHLRRALQRIKSVDRQRDNIHSWNRITARISEFIEFLL
jgi:hypothetical protein